MRICIASIVISFELIVVLCSDFLTVYRNVQGSDKQIDAGLKSLKMNGFINYFGLQRFGTNIAVPTHVVGKALLLGDWQRVCSPYLLYY